ncbi:hypothetical protein PHMEG_00034580, partial [Phytophthora megakarya]
MDDDLLCDLSGFLDDCDVLPSSTELQALTPIANDATALIADSDQLLAETETLLASYERNDTNDTIVPTASQFPTIGENATLTTPKTPAELRKEVKNAQAAKRRLKYRTKLKTERQTLQEQEIVLSGELIHLQHARKRAKYLQQQSKTIPLWKDITKRQKDGRLEAEEYQKSLKRSVNFRSKTISELEEMIRQKLYGANASMICADFEEKRAVELNLDDKVLFEDYLNDLDVVYARTAEVFRNSGAEENPVMSYRIGPNRKWDGDLEFIENLDVLFVPFSFEQTANAMWQSMVQVHQQSDRRHYDHIGDLENTIAVKFPLLYPSAVGRVDMIIHFVMRRYVEAERMVLVWRALSEGEGKFSGMHSDETGWCVVRPNASDGDGDALMRTAMETFVHFVPMDISTRSTNKHTTQFSDLVVSSIDVDAAEIARMTSSDAAFLAEVDRFLTS